MMSSKREMVLHANTVVTICMEICAAWAAAPNTQVYANGECENDARQANWFPNFKYRPVFKLHQSPYLKK